MAIEAVRNLGLLGSAMALSAVAVLAFCPLASRLGLVDIPGGRKAHEQEVPLVGGISIFCALLVGQFVLGGLFDMSYFLFALSLIIAVGLWDDVIEIPPGLKLGMQILASGVMIWAAGVQLHSVGDLLGWRPIGLTILAVPLTVFAIVGVANSVNMLDGLDGLAGSVAASAFAWYALVAADSGLALQLHTSLLLCGAVFGFLMFNLRFPWQARARVFLGDAGSLMIGFALGWLAIDLTQGEGRTFPPIAALWVLLLPLADCVSLMARRIMRRMHPFVGDRLHLHHYLLAQGFSHGHAVAILSAISLACGAVGYLGWKLGLPEPALFWPFFFGFFAYHFWIGQAWAALEREGRACATGAFAALPPEEEKPATT